MRHVDRTERGLLLFVDPLRGSLKQVEGRKVIVDYKRSRCKQDGCDGS
jgi:hypothetical protein